MAGGGLRMLPSPDTVHPVTAEFAIHRAALRRSTERISSKGYAASYVRELCSLVRNAVYLWRVSARLMAMPSAFFVPTNTTSRLPRVTAV